MRLLYTFIEIRYSITVTQVKIITNTINKKSFLNPLQILFDKETNVTSWGRETLKEHVAPSRVFKTALIHKENILRPRRASPRSWTVVI